MHNRKSMQYYEIPQALIPTVSIEQHKLGGYMFSHRFGAGGGGSSKSESLLLFRLSPRDRRTLDTTPAIADVSEAWMSLPLLIR